MEIYIVLAICAAVFVIGAGFFILVACFENKN
jgi:hypothetical protein